MSGPVPFFGFSGWPGARAAASAVEIAPGLMALSVHLDPMDLVLHVPPFPGGERFMVGFLRDVARSAAGMADQLAANVAAEEGARHAALDPDDAAWFAAQDQAGRQ